jgi:hypothetical protein
MKISLKAFAALPLLALVGCTQPTATASAAPPPAIVVDAGPAPAQALATISGERLKLKAERGADGSVRVRSYSWDAKFKETCEGMCGSDGKTHCLPARAKVIDSFYADKDCTQRLAAVVKGRSAPAHAALHSKDLMTGDTYPCEYDNQTRIFKMEGAYRESFIYFKNEKSGSCTKITSKEDNSLDDVFKHQQLFSLSAEVSPSEFVELVSAADDESNGSEWKASK